MATKKDLELKISDLEKEITTLTRDKNILNELLSNSTKEKRQLEEEKMNILQNNEKIITNNTVLQSIIGDKELQIKELTDLIHFARKESWKALLKLFWFRIR